MHFWNRRDVSFRVACLTGFDTSDHFQRNAQRAQRATDINSSKANLHRTHIARGKSQAIVLCQWPRDASRLTVKAFGAEVTDGSVLRVSGVTFHRLLHFRARCCKLRRKVCPRIASL